MSAGCRASWQILVQGQVRQVLRPSRRTTWTRSAAPSTSRAPRRCATNLGRLRGAADHRRRAQRVDQRSTTRTRRAWPSSTRTAPPSRGRRHLRVYLVLRAGMCCRPEEHTALCAAEVPRRRRRAAAPEARQRPRGPDRRASASSRRSAHQVDRDGRLLHRRRRLHAGHALAAERRPPPTATRSRSCRRPSSTTRPRPPRNYDTTARRRASSC